MKNFDKENYQRHLRDLKIEETKDPFLVTTYLRGAFDIANSFNTEEVASGVLSRNDMIQECYFALCKAWANLNWDAIHEADNPQGHIWAYLKKNIDLDARHKVHEQKDGIRIPRNKRWEGFQDTKNVDDFLSQLFPTEWFAENDERLDLIDYNYNTRYDVEQLGLAFEDVFTKYLSEKETLVVAMSFGIGTDRLSGKEISKRLNISDSNVRKIKQRSFQKLNNEDVKNYLQEFYDI